MCAVAFSPEQLKLAARALRVANNMEAGRKVRRALIATGLVESNLTHLTGGDRDSTGFLQQRPSQGWGPVGESVEQDARQFVSAAQRLRARGFHGSAGQLAQAVQRSAFPERYQQRLGQAKAIIGQVGGPSGRPGAILTGASGQAGLQGVAQGSEGLVPLLRALQGGKPGPNPTAGIAAPGFSAGPAMPGGYQSPVSAGGPEPKRDVNALLAAIQTQGGGVPDIVQRITGQGGQQGGGDGANNSYLRTVMRRANIIDRKELPYLWGGGHQRKIINARKATPLDCSGAVSAALGIDPRVSGQFVNWGRSGDGGKAGITVYANKDHVLMKINGRFWGTSKTNPGGGAGWIPSSAISGEYLSRFTARHLPVR